MSAKRGALADVLNQRVDQNHSLVAEPIVPDLSPNASPREATPPTIPVADLRFRREQQPREMLPDAYWERLAAADKHDPAAVLDALREASAHQPASQRVLEHVEELARSIRSSGVLVPLSVVWEGSTYVVLDGHCRAMASVIAGRDSVPANVVVREDSGPETELTDAGHRFVLNMTQERLTPLEGVRLLEHIVSAAARVVLRVAADGQEGSAGAEEIIASLDGDTEEATPEVGEVQAITPDQPAGRIRALALEARKLVLEVTGLTVGQYHQLYRLRRLHPEAKKLAEGLSEGHLAAIVGVPTDLQPLLVRLVLLSRASVKETRSHCKLARLHGEDYLVERYADALHRREAVGRRRTSVSWEPLLRAIPDDVTPRVSALRAELAALDEGRRSVRLEAIARQCRLLDEARRALGEILVQYGHVENTLRQDGDAVASVGG